MNRWIAVLWCTTVLPFATLPWVTIARSQPQPWYSSHALFHVVYLPIIAVAIYAAVRLATSASVRPIRWLAWLLVVAQAAGLAGHTGELISVFRHGGLDAGEEIFDESLHAVSAALTVPGLLAGIALVVMLTLFAVVDARARRTTDAPVA